jgi:hypothetical protein
MIRRRGKRAHQLKFVYPQSIIAVVIDSIDATICRGACRGAGITIRFTDTERDLQYLFLILIRYCTCIITRRGATADPSERWQAVYGGRCRRSVSSCTPARHGEFTCGLGSLAAELQADRMHCSGAGPTWPREYIMGWFGSLIPEGESA